MNILIKGKEQELKFTFNSFKYMEDFDFANIGAIETKPFKMVSVVQQLLLGAVNHNPKVVLSQKDVDVFLEHFLIEGSIADLLEELMKLLEDSSFFKSLQRKAEKMEQ